MADLQSYLSDTEEMVRQGKHAQALERFIWFHEHALEHDPAIGAVRLSFALGYWSDLGDVFPPAKAALVEMRDRTSQQVIRTGGTFRLFHDVVAINGILEENSNTIDLFEAIEQATPDLAKDYWHVAKNAIIDAKRYDIARKYIGNAAQEFSRIKARYDELAVLYDELPPSYRAFNENHFVEENLQSITVALAIGDQNGAKEIQRIALAVIDDPRLRDAIPASANDD